MEVTGGGGGIFNSGEMTLTSSVISHNSVTGRSDRYGNGGGVYNDRLGTATLMNSTVLGNWAAGNGGGIYNLGGTLTVTNSTISGNSATSSPQYFGRQRGGGIYNTTDGFVTITNSTISGNSARDYAAGIGNIRGTMRVVNSIVANNVAWSDADVYGLFSGGSDYNLIGALPDNQQQSVGDHTLFGSSAAPLDAMLSELADLGNGQWGYYLLPGSPALDAGNNALAVDPDRNPLLTDQVGNDREQNGTVDMGALEGGPDAAIPAVTYLVESFERTTVADGVLTFWEALEAASSNREVGDAPAGSPYEQDRIEFAGTFPDVLPLQEPITLQANLAIVASQANRITVDARGNSRVFEILAGSRVLLEWLTITGGWPFLDRGGGIYNSGALTVQNSTISGNRASNGGGIYSSGTLSVKNSTISANSTNRDGGGIYNSGALTVTDSTVSDNSVGWQGDGGGIYNYYGTLTLTNSTLSGNSARWGYGNAIYSNRDVAIESGVRLDVVGNLFVEGSATLNGTLALEALDSLGDLGAGEWGYQTLRIIQADGGLGETTFLAEPATDEHLGHGVFYRDTSYGDTAVDVNLFQAGPGDADGDGLFEFADLIGIFSESGAYYGNTDVTDREWTGGDFNGDGSFTFADLVAAFSSLGAYYGGNAYAALPAANEVMAAAHDVVLASGVVQEPPVRRSSLSELAWITEYERSAAGRRPASPIAPAVDELLAMWP